MKLHVLGSGSSGNCYLLETETECLVIEQGLPMRLAKIALNFNIQKIVGGIQSHCHKDHSGYTKEFEACGIEIYKPTEPGTAKFGNFKIQSFPLVHDVPCFGFVIWHPDCGPIVFATDTEYVPVTFRGIKPSTLMLECSYQSEYLPEWTVKSDRQYFTHMEAETFFRCVEANAGPFCRAVIALHGSFGALDDKYVIEKLKSIVDPFTDVLAASAGMVLELK